jgi:1,2-diacylglycerol 3-alpha-glucosyltransferase
MIPYGLDAKRFSPETRLYRSEIRRELGIPDDAKIILTSAMLDRTEKRIDYIVKEMSSLESSLWFVAAGQRTGETSSLEEEAERLMPGRLRFISWPMERVHLLYGAGDIFVLGSLIEAFGRVIIEAMLSGLPVIIHNGPVFKWIADGTSARMIDMSSKGALQQALKDILLEKNYYCSTDQDKKRFSWEALVPQYLNMYDRVMTSNQKESNS